MLKVFPLANKLKFRNAQMVTVREMMVEGILSIQAGENPKMLEKKLLAFLTPEEKETLLSGEERQRGVAYEETA